MTWPVIDQTHTLTQTREVRRDAERPKGDRDQFSASLDLWITGPPSPSFLFYLVRRYHVFLCNEESKNSLEGCLNLTCFRTFTALYWKRDVSKKPFQFILETGYR